MKQMKRYILIGYGLITGALSFQVEAQEAGDGAVRIVKEVAVERPQMTRNGEFMAVEMKFSLDELRVDGNRAVLLTPRIVKGKDSLDLSSIGIYGRRRYYYYVRNGENMLTGDDEMTFKAAEKPDTLSYQTVVPYRKWMNGSRLVLRREDYGCCHTLVDEQEGMLIRKFVAPSELEGYMPALAYVCPVESPEKNYSLKKSAFIDFPVNKTVIYPDYRGNYAELNKIQNTIDSVKSDPDIRITSLSIQGFASPESPLANNERLAAGRTEALKAYVMKLYHFPSSFIQTSFVAEDWAGLRAYVEKSNLEHRDDILALIDADLHLDDKEARIKKAFPGEYQFLLQHCYPALRHSDYKINYNVRKYTDVEEIKRIMKEKPQKLSMSEFYLAAQSMKPGSDEYNEVFEIAVRMYPDNAVANLNAANTAMSRRNLKAAEAYLAKAGTSPQAVYARGVFELLSGRVKEAKALFEEAQRLGVPEAVGSLKQLEEWEEENQ